MAYGAGPHHPPVHPPPFDPRLMGQRPPGGGSGKGAALAMTIVGLTLTGTGLFLLGLFTLLDVLFARPVWDDWALDVRGVTAEAEPLSFRRQGTGHTSGHNTTVSHVIELRYDDEDGDSHKAEIVSADREVLAAVGAKEPIQIEYDPSDHDLIRIAGSTASIFGNYLVLILVATIGGMGLLIGGLRRRRRTRG